MQPFSGTQPVRVDENGVVMSTTPYASADVQAALKTSRYEVFRYELHRLVGTGAGRHWEIQGNLNFVEECTISYNRKAAKVMRTATFTMGRDVGINWYSDQIRCFWLMQMPDGLFVEWCMGTFIPASPDMSLTNAGMATIQAYDPLVRLSQVHEQIWRTVPAGENAVGTAHNILAAAFPYAGRLWASSDKVLATPRVFEVDTPILEEVNDLLEYAGYERVRSHPYGSYIARPIVRPSTRPVEYMFRADTASVIAAKSGRTKVDLYESPNQWMRVVSRPNGTMLKSIKTLTDPDNPLSTTRRDVVIQDFKRIEAADQATLDKIVAGLYEEGQLAARTTVIETALWPSDHADCITLNFTDHPEWEYTGGIYIEREWTFPMVAGGKMQHTCDLRGTAAGEEAD